MSDATEQIRLLKEEAIAATERLIRERDVARTEARQFREAFAGAVRWLNCGHWELDDNEFREFEAWLKSVNPLAVAAEQETTRGD